MYILKKGNAGIFAVILVLLGTLLSGCSGTVSGSEVKTKVGYTGGPLLASLYIASSQSEFKNDFETIKLGSSSDVAYALLSGDLDAGFVEATKLSAMKELSGFKDLRAVGKVVFPYGSTVIVKKGLNIRVNELNSKKIAISSEDCKLYKVFLEDSKKLGIDKTTLKVEVMPFDAMIPALEAGVVDAAVTKGSYSIIAKQFGHNTIYQNWELQAGDECCPPIIDQLELVLFANPKSVGKISQLAETLVKANGQDAEVLRDAISKATNISKETLKDLPLAKFEVADQKLLESWYSHDH